MSQYYYNPFGNNSDVNEARRKEILKKQQINSEKKELRIIGLWMGSAIVTYLLIQFAVLWVLKFFEVDKLYETDVVFQTAVTIVGVSFLSLLLPFGIMAVINKKRYAYSVFPAEKKGFLVSFAWVGVGMAVCIISNFVVGYISIFFKEVYHIEFTQSTMPEINSVFACVLQAIGIAIIPAICEELAMRCFCVQLLRKYGKGFAVAAVSIIFGLLHANIIQFLFAALVGLILGFITVKTDNILPAIFVHAFNNGTSVLNSILKYAGGEAVAENITVIAYIFWFALGVVSLVFLLIRGEFKTRNDDKYTGLLTTGQKCICFIFPGMILPMLPLVVATASSIKPV